MTRLELITVNLVQFTNMAAPRGLVKTVIPVSLKPKRIRTLEYALGHHSKTTCRKSAESMRYRVRPKFEFYRKSLLITSKIRKTDLGDALSVRRLRFRISRFYFSVYHLVF